MILLALLGPDRYDPWPLVVKDEGEDDVGECEGEAGRNPLH